MLNIEENKSRELVVSGFSNRTKDLLEVCYNHLDKSGLHDSQYRYFVVEEDHWHLKMSIKDLGFLSKDMKTDTNFKKLISSVEKDIGKFCCLLFPCHIGDFPYKDRLVIFTDWDSYYRFRDKSILGKVKISAYGLNGVLQSLSNFTFSLSCNGGYLEQEKMVKEMLLNCHGDEDLMAKSLNKSKWGNTNWKPCGHPSMKYSGYDKAVIESIDGFGNIHFIEVLF